MKIFKICTKFLNKRMSLKKIIGFSLVELMISLITISCIAAAFAPVITKKINKSAVAIKSGNQLLSECSKWGSDCKACYPQQCIVCAKTCQSNQHLNTDKCECEACASNCIACTSKGTCTRCAAGYYLSGSTCSKCQEKYNNKFVCCPEGSTNQTTPCSIQNAGFIDTAGVSPN